MIWGAKTRLAGIINGLRDQWEGISRFPVELRICREQLGSQQSDLINGETGSWRIGASKLRSVHVVSANQGVALDTATSDRSPDEYGPNFNTIWAWMQMERILTVWKPQYSYEKHSKYSLYALKKNTTLREIQSPWFKRRSDHEIPVNSTKISDIILKLNYKEKSDFKWKCRGQV